jgi:DNA repair protein RadC
MPILREIKIRYAFKEVDCEITGQALNEPQRIYEVFNFLKFEPKEKFIVVNLSNQNTIMNYEVVATGTVSLRQHSVTLLFLGTARSRRLNLSHYV